MIYELKIELFDGRLPVTRVIHIDENSTLKQVHYVIQTVFDWSGLRPHIFLHHYGDEVMALGDSKERSQPALKFFSRWIILEEKDQILSHWLQQVGDSLVYEYYQNFRKRRFHLIELTNIVEADPKQIYPYCLSAEYLSPKESYASRTSTSNQYMTSKNVNSLTSQINRLLIEEEIIISEPALNKEAFYVEKLHHTAFDFLYEKPWTQIAENQIVSIVDHYSDIQLFCSVGGSDGQEPGLSLFVGKESLGEIQRSAALYQAGKSALQTLDAFEKFYGLGIVFKKEKDVPYNYPGPLQDFKELWKQLPIEEAKDTIPLYFSYHSKQASAEVLTVKEMRWLILCFEQIIAVSDLTKKGLHLPSINQSNLILERIYSPIYKQYINQEIRLHNN